MLYCYLLARVLSFLISDLEDSLGNNSNENRILAISAKRFTYALLSLKCK